MLKMSIFYRSLAIISFFATVFFCIFAASSAFLGNWHMALQAAVAIVLLGTQAFILAIIADEIEKID